jgi:RNA-directed DNA polymerase
MSKTKPFSITKEVVWEAYKKVKSNKGSAGVDDVSIEEFDKDLKNNLYKIWNRMSSGSYFPSPVKLVEIGKRDGGVRPLGIPTVGDRVAQMAVKIMLEPSIEPYFHPDSYGYRPGKSALEAVGKARERCWRYNWVLDLDIKGFFDNLRHELLMRALQKHTDNKWVLLYIGRWLKAPMQTSDGVIVDRDKGTPQGGVISPLLANLYLHYCMDEWLRRNYPKNPFERYADDSVVHCKTVQEAQELRDALGKRFSECGLELHPEKTKIVYCKDDDRRENYPVTKFDFLGYTYRSRRSKNRWGKYFVNFLPAVSNRAKKDMRQVLRSWKIHLRSDKTLLDISRMINPMLRGWINYYGRYYKSELYCVFQHLNRTLARWATQKYKRLRGHKRRAMFWLGKIASREPLLFYHWKWGIKPAPGQ